VILAVGAEAWFILVNLVSNNALTLRHTENAKILALNLFYSITTLKTISTYFSYIFSTKPPISF